MAKTQETPVEDLVLPEVPTVLDEAVSSESQEVASPVLPSISNEGVDPGTSVTLPDGTVVTHY